MRILLFLRACIIVTAVMTVCRTIYALDTLQLQISGAHYLSVEGSCSGTDEFGQGVDPGWPTLSFSRCSFYAQPSTTSGRYTLRQKGGTSWYRREDRCGGMSNDALFAYVIPDGTTSLDAFTGTLALRTPRVNLPEWPVVVTVRNNGVAIGADTLQLVSDGAVRQYGFSVMPAQAVSPRDSLCIVLHGIYDTTEVYATTLVDSTGWVNTMTVHYDQSKPIAEGVRFTPAPAVLSGTAVTATAVTNRLAGMQFTWYRNDTVLTTSDSATLMLPSAAVADQGHYRYAAVKGADSAFSDSAELEVVPDPGLTVSDTLVYGNPLEHEFYARITTGYNRGMQWYWYVDGQPPNGPFVQRSDTYCRVRHTFDGDGTYRVTVSMYVGGQRIRDSAVCMVTIAQDPTVPITPSSRMSAFPDSPVLAAAVSPAGLSITVGLPSLSGDGIYPAGSLSLLNVRGQVLYRQTITGLLPGFQTILSASDYHCRTLPPGIVLVRLDCPGQFCRQTLLHKLH